MNKIRELYYSKGHVLYFSLIKIVKELEESGGLMKFSRMKKILKSAKFHVICDESTVKVFDKDAVMVGVVDNTIPTS